jgi:hypothetical protein
MHTLSSRTRLDLAIVRLNVDTFRALLNTVPVKDPHHSRRSILAKTSNVITKQ